MTLDKHLLHSNSVSGEKTEEDEEEVSNLQLSWEMLELAKVIYQKWVYQDYIKFLILHIIWIIISNEIWPDFFILGNRMTTQRWLRRLHKYTLNLEK